MIQLLVISLIRAAEAVGPLVFLAKVFLAEPQVPLAGPEVTGGVAAIPAALLQLLLVELGLRLTAAAAAAAGLFTMRTTILLSTPVQAEAEAPAPSASSGPARPANSPAQTQETSDDYVHST
jgi:hypothetical protein